MSGVLGGLIGSFFPTSGFELVSTIIPADAATTIEFTNINTLTEYKHLHLRLWLRADSSSAGGNLNITFNGDASTANYVHFNAYGEGTTISNSSSVSTGNIAIRKAVGPSTETNEYLPTYLYIYDFLSTQKNKTTLGMTGGPTADTYHVAFGGGVWESTTAINRITLTSIALNQGSRASLYGIRG